MLKIALTGGIATGKSYVLDRFRRLGVPCLDADDLAHGVTAAGTEATAAIAARFGEDVLAADGAVDRKKLGPIVFADASAPRELEAIVHPAVPRDHRWLARLRTVGDGHFAVSESGAAALRDRRRERARPRDRRDRPAP
jgi:dephospho-CoA kinase